MIFLVEYKKKSLNISNEVFQKFISTNDFSLLEIDNNTLLLLVLIPFVLAFVTFAYSVKKIQNKPLLQIVTGRNIFDYKRVIFGLFLWIILASITTFIILDPNTYNYQFVSKNFIPLLFIALALIPFQIAIEEIIFRGYLLQGLSFFSKYKLFPVLFTTIIFAVAHIGNPEFQSGIIQILPIYLIPSLLFGVITILDDGLELPIGLHLGNNLFVALVLSSTDGAMRTDSIFQTTIENILPVLPIVLIITAITTLIISTHKYSWKLSTLLEKHS